MLIHETLKMLTGCKTPARWNFQEHASSRGKVSRLGSSGAARVIGVHQPICKDRHGSHKNADPCHLEGETSDGLRRCSDDMRPKVMQNKRKKGFICVLTCMHTP